MSSTKVAVYVRVSTSDQNTEIQKNEITTYLKVRGLNQFEIFEDKKTGTNTDRPKFKEMIRSTRDGKFEIVIVWKLDRFARSLKDLINHLNEFSELGVQFISLKDQIDMTTSAGKLMLHIIGAFGQFEADLIKERVRSGIANARSKGTKFGRPRTTDASKVIALRNQGLSMGAIAKQLGISKTSVHKTLSEKSLENSVDNIESIGSVDSFEKE